MNQSDQAHRIQQVRKQEKQFAKKMIQSKQAQALEMEELAEKQRRYQDYLLKLKQIQELTEIKQKTIMEIGKAQKTAHQQAVKHELDKQNQIMKQQQDSVMAQSRFGEAFEWQKFQWSVSDIGKKQAVLNMKKETFISEKQKEQTSLSQYKEQSKSRIQQGSQSEQSVYTEYIDKNLSKKSILKPQDFSKTFFHNPVVINHIAEEEQENAMEKANMTHIETLNLLEEKAKTWREQERTQMQRSIKAISQEKEKKLQELQDHELKKAKYEQITQKQKEQSENTIPNQEVKKLNQNRQKQLELIQAKNEYGRKVAKMNKPQQNISSLSPPEKHKKNQKMKLSQKNQLDPKFNNNSNNPSNAKSTNRVDYSAYPLNSTERFPLDQEQLEQERDQQRDHQAKRVKFADEFEQETSEKKIVDQKQIMGEDEGDSENYERDSLQNYSQSVLTSEKQSEQKRSFKIEYLQNSVSELNSSYKKEVQQQVLRDAALENLSSNSPTVNDQEDSVLQYTESEQSEMEYQDYSQARNIMNSFLRPKLKI